MSDEIEGEIVDEGTPATGEALVIDPMTRAEIDMQIATAKRYPRDLVKVSRDIVAMATLDEQTAESCFYSLKRRDADGGQKIIQGPSIRLAEIALSCFGNIRAGTRSLGETEDGRFVRELGICHDVEKNVMVAREVKRRITNKLGKRYGDDMVGTTMAAAGSIALRNAVLTVVPRALIKPAYEKAKEVATGRTKSLTAKRNDVVVRLTKLSPLITLERVLVAVEKASLEEVGWDEVEHLIGLGTAIKDGVQTVEEAFPPPPIPVAPSTLETFADGGKDKPAAAAPEPAQEPKARKARAKADPASEAPQEAAGEAAAHMQEVAGPPKEREPGADDEPVYLPAGTINTLKMVARKAGVSWDQTEGVLGGPIAQFTLAGESVDGLEAHVRTVINRLPRVSE